MKCGLRKRLARGEEILACRPGWRVGRCARSDCDVVFHLPWAAMLIVLVLEIEIEFGSRRRGEWCSAAYCVEMGWAVGGFLHWSAVWLGWRFVTARKQTRGSRLAPREEPVWSLVNSTALTGRDW